MLKIKLFPFFLACIFFLTAYYLMSLVLPVAYQVKITVMADHADAFKIYYARRGKHFDFDEKYSSRRQKTDANVQRILSFSLRDIPLDKLRLDPGDRPGIVRLYKIIISSHFAADTILDSDDIFREFYPGKDGVSIRKQDGYVEISASIQDPFIISHKNFYQPLSLRVTIVSLSFIFALALYFLIKNLTLEHFRRIFDIDRIQPSQGSSVHALDGLRGIAALMVIMDHTWDIFKGIGASGVWIFFSLSGFLLARSFVLKPASVIAPQFLGNYFIKRFKRILPLYYGYIIIIYVLSLRMNIAIRHFFFLQGDGYLWAIPQEMFFYLILPFIMLANFLIFRGKAVFIAPALLLMMIGANYYIDRSVIALYGMHHQKLRAFIGVFISGVLFSYLYYGIYQKAAIPPRLKRITEYGCVFIGIILLFIFCFLSNGRLLGNQYIYAQKYFGMFGFGAGLLIFCVIAAERTFLNKLLALPLLRSIGVISFSIYLLHPLILIVIKAWNRLFIGYEMNGFQSFGITLFCTYFVACFTYKYVEKPFLK